MATLQAITSHLCPSAAAAAGNTTVDIPPWSLASADGGLADEVVGPDYSPSRETAGTGAAATSVIVELTMDSEDSTIYPGVDRRPGVEGAADSAAIHDARFRGLGIDPAGFGHPEFDSTAGKANGTKGHPLNATADTPDLFMPGVQPYTRDVHVYIPAAAKAPSSSAAPFIIVNDGVGYVEVMAPVMDTLIAEGRLPANLVAIFANSGGSDAQASQRGLEYDTADGTF